MTAVKVCGLTRAEDVELACALGAAYLGFNFVESSPRRVSPEAARELSDSAAPGVLRVGIFKGEDADAIARAVALCGLDLVQLHRPLTAQDLDRAPVPVIAVASDAGGDGAPPLPLLIRCHALLLDASEGSGRALDPDGVRGSRWPVPVPVFVAGGLTAASVGAVIRALRPAAVDVASGGESSPGKKDREKLTRLFEAVRRADAEASEAV